METVPGKETKEAWRKRQAEDNSNCAVGPWIQFRDEALITAAGTKGTLTPHVNSGSHEGTSSIDESLPNERKRIELFHIRVIINHTKVETIFDTRSQAKLILESLVNKLGLETKPHPKPYPLRWIHDKAKLNVTKQCKVKFVITSKLVDEVKIDVIPLDIYGTVLGSPYLYDKKAIIFTSKNTIAREVTILYSNFLFSNILALCSYQANLPHVSHKY